MVFMWILKMYGYDAKCGGFFAHTKNAGFAV